VLVYNEEARSGSARLGRHPAPGPPLIWAACAGCRSRNGVAQVPRLALLSRRHRGNSLVYGLVGQYRDTRWAKVDIQNRQARSAGMARK